MTEKKKVIEGLHNAWNYLDTQRRTYESIIRGTHVTCFDDTLHAIDDAIALLKRSFTPQEVYDTVIEHAQHDMRFKLGDKIDYSFTDVVDILNVELMCKAGDM